MSAAPSLTLGEGERRVCTIVFCDLIGSTGLAERLDPEEWADVVRGAFAAMVAPIARYEGTVARLLGDAVLAYFGAPVAHEDDPERAVLAALEMARAVRAYGERLPAGLGAGLAVRVGVNTGLVVLQDVRAGGAFEHTAIGDVANVAARLQSLAEPSTVVVSDRTQRQIAENFTFRPLGPVPVKGREAPVTAYVATGPAGRAAAATTVLPAPLVGRERELGALRQAMADVRAGRGRVCALIADAGLGKTRLLREAHAYWLATTPIGDIETWTETRGESFAQGQPYGVLRPQLLALLGATGDDPPDALVARLAEAWRDAPAEERERRARATGLVLGLGGAGAPGELEGEKLRDEIVAAVTDLVRARHLAGPGVLAFDDLQWSDAATTDMLQRLAPLCDDLPILLLLSFRPERQSAAWRLRQWLETDLPYRYEEIALGPLTDADAHALVTHLLDGAALSAPLSQGVLRRAEGNPLFIEELVRALVEADLAARGGLEARPDIPLPDTVQALLTARVDRLDEDARRVSHAAAVIGRTFSQPVLAEVTAAPDLDRHLTALERHDVVREEARRPERRYAFRHPLLQEATYASILRARRRELHAAVARAIERLAGDRLEELSAIIGRHLAEAGDPGAIRYLRRAGERALRLHALDEAVAAFAAALPLAKRASDAAELRAVYGLLGRAHELRAAYEDAVAAYEEMAREGAARSDPAMEADALAHQAAVHTMPARLHDPERAARSLERAVELAQGSTDRELYARIQWTRMFNALWSGNISGAMRIGEEVLELARALGLPDLEASTLNSLSHAYRESDRFADALAAMESAAERFRELGDVPMVVDSLGIAAYTRYLVGDVDRLLAVAAEARRSADEIGHDFGRADVSFYAPLVDLLRGDYAAALRGFEETLGFARAAGHVGAQIPALQYLGQAYLEIGALDRAEAASAEATALAREHGLPWTFGSAARVAAARGELERARGLVEEGRRTPIGMFGHLIVTLQVLAEIELALAEGRNGEAAELAARHRDAQEQVGLRIDRAELGWLAAEALRRAGRAEDAARALDEADRLAALLPERRIQWRALATRARLADASGDASSAAAARAAAARITDGIAAALDPTVREAFRAVPEVRALG